METTKKTAKQATTKKAGTTANKQKKQATKKIKPVPSDKSIQIAANQIVANQLPEPPAEIIIDVEPAKKTKQEIEKEIKQARLEIKQAKEKEKAAKKEKEKAEKAEKYSRFHAVVDFINSQQFLENGASLKTIQIKSNEIFVSKGGHSTLQTSGEIGFFLNGLVYIGGYLKKENGIYKKA